MASNVFDPMVNVAVRLLLPSVTVALVCARHMTDADALISSWMSTCLRLFNTRTPREKDVLHICYNPCDDGGDNGLTH